MCLYTALTRASVKCDDRQQYRCPTRSFSESSGAHSGSKSVCSGNGAPICLFLRSNKGCIIITIYTMSQGEGAATRVMCASVMVLLHIAHFTILVNTPYIPSHLSALKQRRVVPIEFALFIFPRGSFFFKTI